MKKPVAAYLGLTHLGLVYSASSAAKGFRTVCFDTDAGLVASLAKGRMPLEEPGLAELHRKGRKLLTYTSDATVLAQADIAYISADVPTDDAGRSDLTRTRALIELAAKHLRRDALLVVLCQVPPGFMRSLAVPRVFPQERLFYQVETLVFGQAIERAQKPERYIVGASDSRRTLPALYAAYLAAWRCPLLLMRYESAELTKIAINCCLAASVSTANTLAELCEKISADWSEIAPALKLDRRIGPYAYLAPGLGIAGGNIERDLATIVRMAEENGTDPGVVKAWIDNSKRRRNWAAVALRKVIDKKPDARVAVWGLTYKENTNSTKNSPSLATLAQFPGRQFRRHDPALEAKDDPLEVARGADALMILTPWPDYRKISPARIAKSMRGRLVIDPYGVLDRAKARAAGLTLQSLGRTADA